MGISSGFGCAGCLMGPSCANTVSEIDLEYSVMFVCSPSPSSILNTVLTNVSMQLSLSASCQQGTSIMLSRSSGSACKMRTPLIPRLFCALFLIANYCMILGMSMTQESFTWPDCSSKLLAHLLISTAKHSCSWECFVNWPDVFRHSWQGQDKYFRINWCMHKQYTWPANSLTEDSRIKISSLDTRRNSQLWEVCHLELIIVNKNKSVQLSKISGKRFHSVPFFPSCCDVVLSVGLRHHLGVASIKNEFRMLK